MANPVWPVTLPQLLRDEGFSEQPPDLSIRTSMSAGPAKVRRRQTATVRPFQARLTLTKAQVETLDVFYVTTLKSGSLRFDWVQPRTQAASDLRFTAPPRYSPASGDVLFNAELSLEILP